MSGYHPDDFPVGNLTDHSVEEDGDLDGDTLAQFIWREVGDADGNEDEAIRMLERARDELSDVITVIALGHPDDGFDPCQALYEGWCIVDGYKIQRNTDGSPVFEDDAEAEMFVFDRASQGSVYHINARKKIDAFLRKMEAEADDGS